MKKEIDVFEKWALNTAAEDMNDVFGINKYRFNEINDCAMTAVTRVMLSPGDVNNGVICESALNSSLPQNLIEAFALGWCLGRSQIKINNLLEQLITIADKEK